MAGRANGWVMELRVFGLFIIRLFINLRWILCEGWLSYVKEHFEWKLEELFMGRENINSIENI